MTADASTAHSPPASQPAVLIASLRPGDIDLSDPKTFASGVPHEYFRVLREEAPLHWQDECEIPVFLPGPGYWALTRYEDIVFVSKHPEIFSSAAGSSALNELLSSAPAAAVGSGVRIPPGVPVLTRFQKLSLKLGT